MGDTMKKYEEIMANELALLKEGRTKLANHAHCLLMDEWKKREDKSEDLGTKVQQNGPSPSDVFSSNNATLTNTDTININDTFLGRTFSGGIPNFDGFIYDEGLESSFTNPVELEEDKAPDFKTVTDSIADLLKYKNLKYGNAALEPMDIFEGKTKVGQRLDDKLARVKNGEDLKKNDIADLIGYLTLVCVENNWTNFEEFKD